MLVTMQNQRWQRRSLRIPKAPGSSDYYVFTIDGGPEGDGVYDVPDELGRELCYGDGYKVKTVADPARGVVYREPMFIEGAHPTKKRKTAAQLASELEALEAKVALLMAQADAANIPTQLDDDEYEIIQDAMLTAGLKEVDYEVDEDDPTGRYERIGLMKIIHDTQTGAYICPICKATKTTESVRNPLKSIEQHVRMAHKNEMEAA